jgi:hypothetical protein
VTDFPPPVRTDDDTVTVGAPSGREIHFKAAAWPALQPLLSGWPVAIDEVSADTGLDAAVLAEVLLAENVCGEATPELASGYGGLLMPAGL